MVEKCGFTLEGTIRHGKFGSGYCDYNTGGFLREDYEKGNYIHMRYCHNGQAVSYPMQTQRGLPL